MNQFTDKMGAPSESTILETNVSGTVASFGIANNSHMFNILSSGLYSYKIRAIIRELSCNARDAHIDSGIPDLPFEIKLPNSMDQHFYVKDFGTGLPKALIFQLYTIYGESTKQQDLKTTGGFGLGSKSPFAYVMSDMKTNKGFTVVSTYEGVRTTYYCYIGDDGGPKVMEVDECVRPADGWEDGQESGLCVSFSVASHDIAKFNAEAQYVLKHFDVMPKIIGAVGGCTFNHTDYVQSGEYYGFERNKSWPSVVMGCVEYPINLDEYTPRNSIERAILRSGVTVLLPMGAVMMTPSREQLQYTGKTIDGLHFGLDKAVDEFVEYIKEQVMAERQNMSAWEWRCHIRKQYLQLDTKVREVIPEILGKFLTDAVERESVQNAMVSGVVKVNSDVGQGRNPQHIVKYQVDANGSLVYKDGAPIIDASDTKFGAQVYHIAERQTTRGGRYLIRKCSVEHGKILINNQTNPESLAFLCEAPPTIYVGDTTYSEARIREAIKDGTIKSALLFLPQKGGTIDHAKAAVEEMLRQEELDGLTYELTSSLPFTPAARSNAIRIDKKLPWIDQVADVEVSVIYAGESDEKDLITLTQLGDLEESAKYYLICDPNTRYARNSNKRVYWCSDDKNVIHEVHRYGPTVMRDVSMFLQEGGAPVTGIVIVDNVAQLKRLKLVENGFQPFWHWFKEWYNLNWKDKLAESAKDICTFEKESWHDRRSYSIGGTLLRYFSESQTFREHITNAVGADHQLIQDMNYIIEKTTPDEKDEDDEKAVDPHQNFRERSRYIHNNVNFTLEVASNNVTHHTTYDLERWLARAWNPVLGLFQQNGLASLCDRSPETAAKVMALSIGTVSKPDEDRYF